MRNICGGKREVGVQNKSLEKHKDSVAYSLMKTIKKELDPKCIMNPGKVLF